MPNPMTGVADQSAKAILNDMKSRASSYGKNFAVVGLMFSGTECLVESVSMSLNIKGGWEILGLLVERFLMLSDGGFGWDHLAGNFGVS